MMQTITLTFDDAAVDWTELAALYRMERDTARDSAALRAAFNVSFAQVFAFAGGRVIGAARAISDGVYYATVVDVAVAGDWQTHGIGRALMDHLLTCLDVDKVYLTSVPGKNGFYEKMGFALEDNAMSHRPDVQRSWI